MKTPQDEIDKLLHPAPSTDGTAGRPPAEHMLTPDRLSRVVRRAQPQPRRPLPAPSTEPEPRVSWAAIQYMLLLFFILLGLGILALGLVAYWQAGGAGGIFEWLFGWS